MIWTYPFASSCQQYLCTMRHLVCSKKPVVFMWLRLMFSFSSPLFFIRFTNINNKNENRVQQRHRAQTKRRTNARAQMVYSKKIDNRRRFLPSHSPRREKFCVSMRQWMEVLQWLCASIIPHSTKSPRRTSNRQQIIPTDRMRFYAHRRLCIRFFLYFYRLCCRRINERSEGVLCAFKHIEYVRCE